MAARPTWRGFLKVSLVTVPVRVFPATDSAATVSFNQLMQSAKLGFSRGNGVPPAIVTWTKARSSKDTSLKKGTTW